MLEKILEEIEAEFDRRIEIQLKIMAGLIDDVYRYGYGKSLEAYQQGELLVESIIRKHMNDGWIPVEERRPEDDVMVLIQVSGKPKKNITLDNAFELGCYIAGNGWILEEYPEWKNPQVIAWQPLPEPYRPGGRRRDKT